MHYTSLKSRSIVAAIAAFSSLTASAVPIVIQTSNAGGNTGTENILFNEPGLQDSGNTVQGISSPSDVVVNFTSTTSLETPSGGQARIEGDFSNLMISLAGGGTFTKAIMNLNANDDGSVEFTVNYVGTAGSPYVETFSVDGNGQNFFQIIADDGAQITSINLVSSDTTFEDVRQIRIGGFQTRNEVPDGGATASMLGLGVIGLIAARRKLGRR